MCSAAKKALPRKRPAVESVKWIILLRPNDTLTRGISETTVNTAPGFFNAECAPGLASQVVVAPRLTSVVVAGTPVISRGERTAIL